MGYLTEKKAKELVREIEKKIDSEKARRFFKHLARKNEIKDLDIPQINMPKTFQTLINVGYASASDSDTSSESSDNSGLKDWSQVFGEDGRLRFNEIVSLIPPSPDDFTWGEKEILWQSLFFSYFALSSYNEKHGVDYELVAPMMSLVFIGMNPPDNHLVHLNFLAKPKNSDAPLDLFFAEVVACGVRANEVNKCWILKPRPSPSPVAMTCDAVYIWHPLDDEEDCKECIYC
ncbi:hypothetical protein POM88_012165 [Heracleum sosnowskyi]|uniref:DUF3615 domain-containing protein n=1 Tax=Heracleum sosnowskyi TaxID=360622 RepID=A0AAD8N1G4_9APIA|nr:hypothetical protein POM88_012165 [Heracleum sosnowskyi]